MAEPGETESWVMRRNQTASSLGVLGRVGKELYLGGNLGVVDQELDLLQLHQGRELENDLLRIGAESL